MSDFRIGERVCFYHAGNRQIEWGNIRDIDYCSDGVLYTLTMSDGTLSWAGPEHVGRTFDEMVQKTLTWEKNERQKINTQIESAELDLKWGRKRRLDAEHRLEQFLALVEERKGCGDDGTAQS